MQKSNRQADQNEITPAMIDAGLEAFFNVSLELVPYERDKLPDVAKIWRAMEAARLGAC